MTPVLVAMGDVVVDVLTAGVTVADLGPLHAGADIAVPCDTALVIGGSAWLLADAARSHGGFRPVVVAAVGDDAFGRAIPGVTRLPGRPTDVVVLAALPGGQRLMLRPRNPTCGLLDAAAARAALADVDPATVAWTWISGYVLADPGAPRRAAARALADWSREHGVPIALDLVPHDFRRHVGTLADVAAALGRVDVLIGDDSTFDDLGTPPGVVIVAQRHTGPSAFGQTVSRDGVPLWTTEFAIPATGIRGTGDRLAVDALARLHDLRREDPA